MRLPAEELGEEPAEERGSCPSVLIDSAEDVPPAVIGVRLVERITSLLLIGLANRSATPESTSLDFDEPAGEAISRASARPSPDSIASLGWQPLKLARTQTHPTRTSGRRLSRSPFLKFAISNMLSPTDNPTRPTQRPNALPDWEMLGMHTRHGIKL
ncbi:MAG: hypothetical protein JNK57_01610 [Planctomycetaceae bacterium]|nr:hypothetical protein [Planctomycetaceae bacterium]